MKRIAAPFLFASLALAFSSHLRAASNLDEIRQLIKAGQCTDALKRISEALASSKAPNAYELYMLRGDCHLQNRTPSLAADAFQMAARHTQELEPRATALAHAYLIKKSVSLAYKPHTGATKGQPLDICRPDTRKLAFAALSADEEAASKSRIKQAEGARKLGPIMEIVDDVILMVGLELASGESKSEMRGELKKILARAKDLITDSLKDMDKDVDRIEKEANTYREFTQDRREKVGDKIVIRKERAWQKKGITKAQANQLDDDAATCEKIPAAVQILAQGIRSEQKDLDSLILQAGKVRKQITKVLNGDYDKIYHKNPR